MAIRCVCRKTMSNKIPDYVDEEREKRVKESLDIQKNTLLRSAWDKATYQVTAVEDTHCVTDDGEVHQWSHLKHSIESEQVTILGVRATN